VKSVAWPEVGFGEAAADVTGGHPKTPQASYLTAGTFPIVDQGKDLIGGFTDDAAALSTAQLPVVVFGDHTKCVKYVDFAFGAGADGVKVLQAREGFDARFLFHFLSSVRLPEAGYSRHFKYLREVRVPRPPLGEQRRIASILDAADALRTKRRQALEKLDSLTQSTFIDMFGDPTLNPKGWPSVTLSAVAVKFSDGPFGSNLKSEHYVEDGVRVVRLQNIGVGRFVDDDRAFISPDHFNSLQKHECLPGDVLVGTLGDPNLRACIQPDWLAAAINKADCVQIRVDPHEACSEWLCALLNCPATEQLAQSLVRGQTRARISMGRLRDMEVPLPPLQLQRQFASRLAGLASLRAAAMRAQIMTDSLFASLQHQAFRGEL
jgi:type I restriction enzyme S subunit